jgi:predicted peroxiredoxin
MANYLLIESRDPYDSNDVQFVYDLATNLKKQGNEVTVFLVQNGVLPARKSPRSTKLDELVKAGIKVVADDFSLRERGITNNRLVPGVTATGVDTIVDRLADGWKTIWH